MGTNGTAVESVFQRVMLELAGCGFAPLGNCNTQGSGSMGRALSADGMTWADVTAPRSDLRASLRHWLKTGRLRGTGRSAPPAIKLTTLFNDGSSLVTGGEGVATGLVLRHLRRLDARLLQRHPLKALIHVDAQEVAAAARLLGQGPAKPSGLPLNTAQLRQLGVPAHLAQLIGGPCAAIEMASQTPQ